MSATLPALHSTFALEQLTKVAQHFTANDFTVMFAPVFGTDLPLQCYQHLHTVLLARQIANPGVRISADVQGGARYDNASRTIELHPDVVTTALAQADAAHELLTVLLHEFGHYLDNVLRQDIAPCYADPVTVAPDAALEEGARFAHRIATLDIATGPVVLVAHYSDAERNVDLTTDYGRTRRYITDSQNQRAQAQDQAAGRYEGFCAGRGEDDEHGHKHAFGHESIEDALARAGFDEQQRKAIYFGNWLRDYSQLVDPKIVRAADAPKDFPTKLSREVLTQLVDLLAVKYFHSLQDTPQGRQAYTVTPAMLGVYRPTEHIDNPKNSNPGPVDPTTIDPDFEAFVLEGDPRLGIDPERSMKRYISGSVAYMQRKLGDAMQAGPTPEGLRDFGAGLHVLEDYFAHSNFTELCLRKLGHNEVLAWTAPADCTHGLPVVTGMFSGSDIIASLAEPMAKLLFPISSETFEAMTPGQRGDAEAALLILLQEHDDPKWKDYLETYLATRDNLASVTAFQDLQAFGFAVGSPLRLLNNAKNMALQSILNLIGNSVDDAQTLSEDPNRNGSSDPTHSQLAKDHAVHPLHLIAIQLASVAVEQVGKAMQAYWKGDTQADPRAVAADFICHPADCQWQDAMTREWAAAHPHELQVAANASQLLKLGAEHVAPIIDRIKHPEPAAQQDTQGSSAWAFIETGFKSFFSKSA